MSEMNRIKGVPVNATATHGTAATATISGVSGKVIFITEASASSDKAGAIMLVKDGSTVIWQLQVGAAAFSQRFSPPLAVTAGADATVTIDSTSAGKANINGVQC